MQRKEFEKNWNLLKMNAQKHWNKLTADDMYQIDGMYDQFVGQLVKRYGYSREIAEKEIQNWQPMEAEVAWEKRELADESPETEYEREKRTASGKKTKIHEFKHPEQKEDLKHPKQKEDFKHLPEGKEKKRKAG